MIEAVLFDLDDTLTDRTATLKVYASDFAAHFRTMLSVVALEDIESTIADLDQRGYRPRGELFEGIHDRLPWVSRPDVSAIESHWRERFTALTVPQAGMHCTLSVLRTKGLRLGLVTNGSVLTQSAKIEQLGLKEYVQQITISEAAGCRKPHPEIFRKALAELSISAGRTMFVGDHPTNDVLGAMNAGMVSVWLEGTHLWPPDQPTPQYRIRRLSEIVNLVA